MISAGVVGSILLGIMVIYNLMKSGEMGCFGGVLIFLLILVLVVGLLGSLLFAIAGGM